MAGLGICESNQQWPWCGWHPLREAIAARYGGADNHSGNDAPAKHERAKQFSLIRSTARSDIVRVATTTAVSGVLIADSLYAGMYIGDAVYEGILGDGCE